MRIKRIIFFFLVVGYLAGLAQRFGLLIGLYVSLLAISFLILFTPIISIVSLFVSAINMQERAHKIHNILVLSWAGLSALNLATLFLFPIIYSKTVLTTFLHHMFLVPSAGSLPVVITGSFALYHWLVDRLCNYLPFYIIWHVVGLILATTAFYFFMQSQYFDMFVISLNASHINY